MRLAATVATAAKLRQPISTSSVTPTAAKASGTVLPSSSRSSRSSATSVAGCPARWISDPGGSSASAASRSEATKDGIEDDVHQCGPAIAADDGISQSSEQTPPERPHGLPQRLYVRNAQNLGDPRLILDPLVEHDRCGLQRCSCVRRHRKAHQQNVAIAELLAGECPQLVRWWIGRHRPQTTGVLHDEMQAGDPRSGADDHGPRCQCGDSRRHHLPVHARTAKRPEPQTAFRTLDARPYRELATRCPPCGRRKRRPFSVTPAMTSAGGDARAPAEAPSFDRTLTPFPQSPRVRSRQRRAVCSRGAVVAGDSRGRRGDAAGTAPPRRSRRGNSGARRPDRRSTPPPAA